MTQPTQTNHRVREKLERDIEKFFAKGGTVTQCPPCTLSTNGKNLDASPSILVSKKSKAHE